MSIELSFIKERSPFSSLVCAFTWSDYSHVEFFIPGKGYLGARPIGGVQLRPLDYVKPVRQAIGTVECTEAQSLQVMDYATRQIKKPYDWLNIFGEGLHQDWTQEPSKWICSILVWAAFQSAGIYLLSPENKDRPTPKDLAESPLVKLQTVKEGKK